MISKRAGFTILLRNAYEALKYARGQPLARAMRKNEGRTTLQFRSDGVYLQLGGNIILQETRDTLIAIQGGDSWIGQIEAEVLKSDFCSRSKVIPNVATIKAISQLIVEENDIRPQVAANLLDLAENADLSLLIIPYSSSNGRVHCAGYNRSMEHKASLKTQYNNFHAFKERRCPYGCGLTLKSRSSLQSRVRAQHDPSFKTQRCVFSGCTTQTEYPL